MEDNSVTLPVVEYYDWSSPCSDGTLDGKGAKYARCDLFLDGESSPDLHIVLRRDKGQRTDFSVIVDAREVYLMLKQHFE